MATLLALLVGVPAGYGIARLKAHKSAIVIMIAVIPIMVWNIRQANKETGGH